MRYIEPEEALFEGMQISIFQDLHCEPLYDKRHVIPLLLSKHEKIQVHLWLPQLHPMVQESNLVGDRVMAMYESLSGDNCYSAMASHVRCRNGLSIDSRKLMAPMPKELEQAWDTWRKTFMEYLEKQTWVCITTQTICAGWWEVIEQDMVDIEDYMQTPLRVHDGTVYPKANHDEDVSF